MSIYLLTPKYSLYRKIQKGQPRKEVTKDCPNSPTAILTAFHQITRVLRSKCAFLKYSLQGKIQKSFRKEVSKGCPNSPMSQLPFLQHFTVRKLCQKPLESRCVTLGNDSTDFPYYVTPKTVCVRPRPDVPLWLSH